MEFSSGAHLTANLLIFFRPFNSLGWIATLPREDLLSRLWMISTSSRCGKLVPLKIPVQNSARGLQLVLGASLATRVLETTAGGRCGAEACSPSLVWRIRVTTRGKVSTQNEEMG